MGRFCERQKARVHCVQEVEAARFWIGEASVSSLEEEKGLRRARRSEDLLRSACEDPPPEDGGVAASRDGLSDLLGPSWIRVLFLKQVHLQNVGAPVNREC